MLVELGLLDAAERPLINELYAYNPLTFDFVLKRRLRLREGETTTRFADAVFMSSHLFRAG